MNIDTNTIVPISVANQNFSKVARLVDQYGSADDDVLASSAKLMQRNTHVYEELAK